MEAVEKETRIQLQAPVAEVTLLEDRAQVTRRGTIDLDAGLARLRLPDVAPVISDKTLRVVLEEGPAGATLADFRVRRRARRREADRPQRIAELDELLRQARQRVAALRQQAALLKDEAQQLVALQLQLLAESASDASWDRADPQQWAQQLNQLEAFEADALQRGREKAFEIQDGEQEVADLVRRRQALEQPSSELGAALEADLQLPQAGRCTLAFVYTVPSACWRPQHSALLLESERGPRLRFSSDACVWQSSGEDWQQARLRFSTARPSLGLEPPLLGEDLLHAQPRQEQMEVQAREETLRTTGLGGRAAAAEPEDLPGVDDGGEALLLDAAHPADVPSDGRPYRVPLGSFESAVESQLVAMPELAAAAVWRHTLSNEGPFPVLAGPVDLLASSGLTGRGSVRFVAPKERFPIGFGPDPAIRVHRRCEETPRKPGPLSRWRSVDHLVELKLSNIGDEARQVLVTERVPVSEVEQVRVVLDEKETSGGARPDKDGMLSWTLQLAPGGTETLRLRYGLQRKADVVGV